VYNHNWQGFSSTDLSHQNTITIFALGGSSWKVTGSDGSWINAFQQKGISVSLFQASNCAYKINWQEPFIKTHEGAAIKNALFSCGHLSHKGEAVLTNFGIEGSGVYPLSSMVREGLNKNKKAQLCIDFKPDLSEESILQKLKASGKNRKQQLEQILHLSKASIDLIKQKCDKEEYLDDVYLVQLLKKLPLEITDLAPIDEAISTVGGIPFDELTKDFELKKLPHHFCIGEMVNWDAPTGGYLLQMCFSMAAHLAHYLNSKN
jgi:uncharacterized flavoprotein (TIGR03862 family)